MPWGHQGPPSPTPLGLREALEPWAGRRETLWRQGPRDETVPESVRSGNDGRVRKDTGSGIQVPALSQARPFLRFGFLVWILELIKPAL